MTAETVLLTIVLGAALVIAALGLWLGYRLAKQADHLLARLDAVQPPRSAPSLRRAVARSPTSETQYLVIMPFKLGLLAELMKVLTTLDHHALEGRTPIVYFNKPRFLYWGDEGWNGARNGWDYYFHPLSDVRLEDIVDLPPEGLELATRVDIDRWTGHNVLTSERLLQAKLDAFGDVKPEFRREFDALFARYIRVRDEVLEVVEEFARSHFRDDNVIGIHYRATDKVYEVGNRLHISGHDPSILQRATLDLYLDEALAVADGTDTRFFLATEDDAALDRARERLGNRIISTAAVRSRSGLPAFLTDGSPSMGQEVLVDCLLLSRCHHFVHGVSNVAWAARLFNPDLRTTHVIARLVGAA
jgi:hypothetical protein